MSGEVLLPLLGGAIIGISASILMAFNGRIAGISGIFSGLLQRKGNGSYNWQLMFVLGLLLGGLILGFLSNPILISNDETMRPIWIMAFSGLLVGIGTRIGSGCTSGHGVCGISRRSKRSIFATLTFISAGIVSNLIFNLLKGG